MQAPSFKPSLGLWVAVIWYALEASQGVSRWMTALGYQVAQTDVADGTPIDRAVFTVLLILAIGILAARRTRLLAIIADNKFLCLLFLYMLVSVVWSDYPLVSIRRWIRSLVDLAMALVVVTDRNALEAECSVLRRVAFINLPLSIYLIKYVRGIGTAWSDEGIEMWVGTTSHKNVLGEVVMTAGIYFLFEIIRNRWTKRMWPYLAYMLMVAWLLRGSPASRSATSALLLGIGSAILLGLFYLRTRMEYVGRHLAGGVLMLMIAGIGVLFYQVSTDQSALGAGIGAVGRDATLTGRTDLWRDLWPIAMDHMMFGVGYGSFWIGNTHGLWDVHFWHPTQGHNGYLDVFLELGIVGIVLLAGTIVASLRGTVTLMRTRFELGALHLVWLVIIVIHNITESSYLRGSVDMWFMFLVASLTIRSQSAAFREPAIVSSRIPAIEPRTFRPRVRPSAVARVAPR
jgi:O-antigen ligase